ncbi:MAG: hypothetical protein ACE5R6_17915 [Candidatus Heimdallarchaeota archaeon]
MDDPTTNLKLFKKLPEALKDMVSHLPTEALARKQIKPLIALLRMWARYEDRALPIDEFHRFFALVMTELSQVPGRNLIEIAATVSEALFQEQDDVCDLLRMVYFLVLSDNQTLIQKYRSHEMFQKQDDISWFSQTMLTLRLRQLYTKKSQIMGRISGIKLGHLLQRTCDHLQKWILRVERAMDQLTLVNQRDLVLNNVRLRRPEFDPEEVLATIQRLGSDSVLEVVLESDVGSGQLVAEFTDNFGINYRVLV